MMVLFPLLRKFLNTIKIFYVSFVMAIALILPLAACGQTSNNQNTLVSSDSSENLQNIPNTNHLDTSESKILVAYFSWSGNTETWLLILRNKPEEIYWKFSRVLRTQPIIMNAVIGFNGTRQ